MNDKPPLKGAWSQSHDQFFSFDARNHISLKRESPTQSTQVEYICASLSMTDYPLTGVVRVM